MSAMAMQFLRFFMLLSASEAAGNPSACLEGFDLGTWLCASDSFPEMSLLQVDQHLSDKPSLDRVATQAPKASRDETLANQSAGLKSEVAISTHQVALAQMEPQMQPQMEPQMEPQRQNIRSSSGSNSTRSHYRHFVHQATTVSYMPTLTMICLVLLVCCCVGLVVAEEVDFEFGGRQDDFPQKWKTVAPFAQVQDRYARESLSRSSFHGDSQLPAMDKADGGRASGMLASVQQGNFMARSSNVPGQRRTSPVLQSRLPPTSGTSPKLPTTGPGRESRGDTTLPPPVCPSLILPHTEARFMVSLDDLLKLTVGSLNINGTSGRTLLEAFVRESEDGQRSLALASVGCEDDPRIVVSGPQRPGEAMLVCGKDDEFYGTFETAGTGNILKFGGNDPVMSIEMGDPADLQMTAFAIDRKKIGSAGRKASASMPGGDAWKISVCAGADAVLVSTCMLALVLLSRQQSERPSGSPGQTRTPHGVS